MQKWMGTLGVITTTTSANLLHGCFGQVEQGKPRFSDVGPSHPGQFPFCRRCACGSPVLLRHCRLRPRCRDRNAVPQVLSQGTSSLTDEEVGAAVFSCSAICPDMCFCLVSM